MTRALEQVAAQIRRDLARTIVGQAEAADLMLVAILCGGHALLEGVPGLGKTLASGRSPRHPRAAVSGASSARRT